MVVSRHGQPGLQLAEPGQALVPYAPRPEKAAEDQERWQSLQQAIDALPPGHHIVVVLYYLEGLSLQEIANVMDIPEGTVKSRLHHARRKLREAMQEQEHRLVPEVAYDFT